METIFALVVFGVSIFGCANAQVNVDFDSCQQRGVLDGVKVAQCKEAKNVK